MIQITVALPLLRPMPFQSGLLKMQEGCISELSNLSGKIASTEYEFGNLEFSFFDSPDAHTLVSSYWRHPGGVREYRLLTISVDGELYIQNLAILDLHLGDGHQPDAALGVSLALDTFQMVVKDLLLLTNVLHPGAMSVIEGFAFCEGELIGKTEALYTEDLFQAIEAASEVGWPPFQQVTIENGWSWFNKSGCIVAGVATNRLGRAWEQ